MRVVTSITYQKRKKREFGERMRVLRAKHKNRLLVGYFPSGLACIAWSLCEDDTRATFIVQQQEVDIALCGFLEVIAQGIEVGCPDAGA